VRSAPVEADDAQSSRRLARAGSSEESPFWTIYGPVASGGLRDGRPASGELGSVRRSSRLLKNSRRPHRRCIGDGFVATLRCLLT
jgi:hypothetical protein